jgi:hypothetical protein
MRGGRAQESHTGSLYRNLISTQSVACARTWLTLFSGIWMQKYGLGVQSHELGINSRDTAKGAYPMRLDLCLL